MLRIELYVDEYKWKRISKETQVCLNTLMISLEELIQPLLIGWNENRTTVIKAQVHSSNIIYKTHIKTE